MTNTAKTQAIAQHDNDMTGDGAANTANFPPYLREAGEALRRGELDQAERAVRAVLEQRPDDPAANFVFGAVLLRRDSPEEAITALETVLRANESNLRALSLMSRALRMAGREDDAVNAAKKALTAQPRSAEAATDLAEALSASGDSAGALAAFRRAVSLGPELARAHLGLAHALILNGEFGAGWREYEWRYKIPGTRERMPKIQRPEWSGMKLSPDERLLLIGDQGFGDTFQFARYVKLAAERCSNIALGASKETQKLLARIPGVKACSSRMEELAPVATWATLSSLPYIFGTELDSIPDETPYLTVDKAKVTAWKKRLAEIADGKTTVGIAWAGRPSNSLERKRATTFDALSALSGPRVKLVSLQIGPAAEQRLAHAKGGEVFDAAPELADFDDTAALICALDCVVTIETAVAHLTGALGRPGFVLLPHVADWRWGEKRADSPWYPSLKLFRQPKPGAWEAAIASAAKALSTLNKNKR